jgi:hypothetical protein
MKLRSLVLCAVLGSAASCGDDPAKPAVDASPGIDAPGIDAPELDAPGIDAAAIDAAPVDAAGMGRIRFVHATSFLDPALAVPNANLDIYIDGAATPLFEDVQFGSATAYVNVPAGTIKLAVRAANAAVTTGALYLSDPIVIGDNASVTALGGGIIGELTVETSKFKITSVADHFAAPVAGKTHLRIVNESHAVSSLGLDLGSDGTVEASVARYAASDEAGLEVAAGADLDVSVKNTAGDVLLGRLLVPAAALASGGELYAVIAGFNNVRPRDTRSLKLLLVSSSSSVTMVNLNPTLYVFGASADQLTLDAFLNDTKLVDSIVFAAKPQVVSSLRPTSTGYTLAFHNHTAGTTPPATPPLASLSTGPLEAGEQYLVLLDGLVADSSLALRSFKDEFPVLDGTGKLRVVNALSGVPSIDVGWVTNPGTAAVWHDVTEFGNLATGAASSGAGIPILLGSTPANFQPGVRVAGDPTTQRRFGTGVQTQALASVDRWFGIAMGALTPATGQKSMRFILLKTNTADWTVTQLANVGSVPPNVPIAKPASRRATSAAAAARR